MVRILAAVIALLLASCAPDNSAPADVVGSLNGAPKQLFAVEVRIGPNWDPSKPPNEQEFSNEHSANLKGLREAGHILMGARYSDIGLIIFSAESADEVRVWITQDRSMTAETFQYEVYVMNVFFRGWCSLDSAS